VNPCPVEGFGLVILEAMALAKPVVATNAGGPREIIDHLRTGLLVPPSDPAALAQGLRQLLADPVKRNALGNAGHERYLTHFTAQQMASRILNIYEQAYGQPCSRDCRPIPSPAL
jgi:glycosyltransferase involved in cell wall biosynthesis